eukprot:GEMP01006392.1.p1 GENE.GEMP01006392.1~~GEMP01006392.1.p1  ORF type:complete len:378 (-),score=58.61 GEMP01006392.1:1400-2533(-)
MRLLLPAAVSAWATVGHEEIARYTEKALVVFGFRANAHARAKVHGDLITSADYGGEEVRKYKALEILHFQPMQPSWECGVLERGATDPAQAKVNYPCKGQGDNHNCILGASYYFLGHFIHDALLEFPEDPRTEIKSLPLIEDVWPLSEQTSANKLKWLLSLVRDMHQPFRWGAQEFDFGKKITVILPDKVSYSLFELFDSILPEKVFQERIRHPHPDIMKQRLEKIEVQETEFLKQHRALANTIAYWFWRWADQTGQILCDVMGELQTIAGHKITGDPNTHIEIPEKTYKDWLAIVETQMIVAGYRSALLLETLHEHRKHHEHLQEGRGRHHPRKHWRENLLTNLGIAVIQLPLMFGILKFCLSDANPLVMVKKHMI